MMGEGHYFYFCFYSWKISDLNFHVCSDEIFRRKFDLQIIRKLYLPESVVCGFCLWKKNILFKILVEYPTLPYKME